MPKITGLHAVPPVLHPRPSSIPTAASSTVDALHAMALAPFRARVASKLMAVGQAASGSRPERRRARPPTKPRPGRRGDFAAAITRTEFAKAGHRRARR